MELQNSSGPVLVTVVYLVLWYFLLLGLPYGNP